MVEAIYTVYLAKKEKASTVIEAFLNIEWGYLADCSGFDTRIRWVQLPLPPLN